MRTEKIDEEVMEVEGCVTFMHLNQLLLFLVYILRSAIKAHHKTLTWENLNYHVPGPNGPIRLLHDVFGYVKPGTLTALMGASGAGAFVFSTNLLDIYFLSRKDNVPGCIGTTEKHWRCYG